MISKTIYYGYSSQGFVHKKNNLPNQDSWLGKHFSFGTVIVVADGLGSKMHSGFGADMVCKSVCDAVLYWHKIDSKNTRHLLMLIQVMWTASVSVKFSDKECCSTCLFALYLNNGDLITAQLGDGIVFLKKKDEAICLTPERQGFGNQTYALGTTWDLNKWEIHEFNKEDNISGVILVTDGVGDDLLRDKFSEFSEYMLEIGSMNYQKRWRTLQHDLNNWPTPYSGDDKTICVLKVNEEL